MFKQLAILLVLFQLIAGNLLAQDEPLKVGVIGLTHSHVHWIFGSEKQGDIQIIGIVEPNRELAQRYAEQHGYSMDLVYSSMDELLANTQPEAVTAFGSVYDHLKVVETFAPKGIHVMVEKPLAANLKQAQQMADLARKHQIHLLTNYETTWYPTNHQAYELLKKEDVVGATRKIIVRDGHKGPKKIGVNQEFLEWLTDPVLNGGGAITDFGCYGANLITWLMDGKKPNAVTAITQQLQPENNPLVDDEAIILLQYDQAVGVIQASWNWPIGRKDMEIYGLKGVIYADNSSDLRVRIAEGYDGYDKQSYQLEKRKAPYHDPFSFLAAVVKNKIEVQPNDLSSLENNLMVMEILDAAIRSAKQNKTIKLKE
ncbi:Gfo/Idh/MocA family protein [Sunxiuqinia elliptica]|uniref:Predicted dehydrogenase n=1 Tax=Sunxiuqinia elliptica TaxID=655355 RepID=A0A1I2ALI4_9BACT|nr:Gfo/Idh/MocA family oxidoreductase [Sunxiuqinia elliptica]SFE44756.1 Predicted dehydrogenase [Sunxiuqinia elliptica]